MRSLLLCSGMLIGSLVPLGAYAQTSCPAGSALLSAVQYSSGPYALAVAAADFNRDGAPDLAVANFAEGSISFLRGRGNGTFDPRVAIATGAGPRNLVAADFNKDGKLDLAVTNLDADAVTVIIGNGDGTFSSTTTTPVSDPRGIAVADFNKDAILDLLVTGSAGVSVLIGGGGGGNWNGAFNIVGPFEASNPWAVAPGDFTGDGVTDFAVANLATSSVSVYLGLGQAGVWGGTFTAGQSVVVGGGQQDILARDLNGDGILDLAAPASSHLSVMYGQGAQGVGDGTFVASSYAAGESHNGITSGDFDSDGRVDLVLTDPGANRALLFRGMAGSQFSGFEAYSLGSASGAVGLTGSDFNNDGALDLAVALSGPGSVAVLLGNCRPVVAITDVQPRNGPVGTAVTITGRGLTSATAVRFNGVTASFNVVSDVLIQTSVPVGATSGPVSVVTGLGSATTPYSFLVGFIPQVSNFNPDQGKPGETVVISGDHFAGATKVFFGSGESPSFTVDSDVQITAVVGSTATTGPVGVGNLIGTGSSSSAFTVLPLDWKPTLVDVRDIPSDQGGKVAVRWLRSDFDAPQARMVTGYRVWRRVPLGLQASSALTTWRRVETSTGVTAFWEPVAEIPAARLEGYAFVAPTTQDSTEDSNRYTAFFVETLTADPFVTYASSVDSGYSVDNLPPKKPPKLAAEYGSEAVTLSWGGNEERDLAGYRLYRGSNVEFTPGPGNLVYSGADTTFVHSGGAGCYKLSAVDIHGNQSRFALATPGGSTTSVAMAVSIDAQPTQIAVRWYVIGLPGVPVRIDRRERGGAWGVAGAAVTDGYGMVEYVDRSVRPGQRLGYRLAFVDGADELLSEETAITVPEARLAFLSVGPNPVRDGTLGLSMSLPIAGRVRLRIYDAAGRVVQEQDLGWRQAGLRNERVSLGRSLSDGVYWARIEQGAASITRKVCVMAR